MAFIIQYICIYIYTRIFHFIIINLFFCMLYSHTYVHRYVCANIGVHNSLHYHKQKSVLGCNPLRLGYSDNQYQTFYNIVFFFLTTSHWTTFPVILQSMRLFLRDSLHATERKIPVTLRITRKARMFAAIVGQCKTLSKILYLLYAWTSVSYF